MVFCLTNELMRLNMMGDIVKVDCNSFILHELNAFHSHLDELDCCKRTRRLFLCHLIDAAFLCWLVYLGDYDLLKVEL